MIEDIVLDVVMPDRLNDLSKDPFDPENLPEEQSFAENVRDVYVDKAKSAAGDYVREAPKRMGRRVLWSMLLIFSLANEYEKDRMLDRLEEGGKVGCYQLFFGEKFSLFNVLRTVIFFGVLAFIIYYLWSNGIIQQMMEQQALIESLQQTATP